MTLWVNLQEYVKSFQTKLSMLECKLQENIGINHLEKNRTLYLYNAVMPMRGIKRLQFAGVGPAKWAFGQNQENF